MTSLLVFMPLSLFSSSSSHRPLFAFSFPFEGVTAQRLTQGRSDWRLAGEVGGVSVSVSCVESTSSAERVSPPSLAIYMQSAVEPWTGSDASSPAAQQHPGNCFIYVAAAAASLLCSHNICLTRSSEVGLNTN